MKQKEFNGPYYVALHINNYCRGIPVKKCPCALSWLCDGVFQGKIRMSGPYSKDADKLLAENFPKELAKVFQDCDKCSAATSQLKPILNGSVKLCPECQKPLGKHCTKKHVLYETWVGSSGACGACVGPCIWR